MKDRKSRAHGTIGLVGLCIGAGVAQGQQAPTLADNGPPPAAVPASPAELQEVLVTGYRKSLTQSTEAKREAIGFIDQINAEDIGKFPDTNIAESFNRIPGITIVREISGEGLNVAIRGLGTSFTRAIGLIENYWRVVEFPGLS